MTRNVRKDQDYINGMKCTAEDYDDTTGGLRVLTATGRRVLMTIYADEKLANREYYPLRLGYASTILRFAGAELPHVTVWLDVPHVPAAAYTAMSRVSYASDCLIGAC